MVVRDAQPRPSIAVGSRVSRTGELLARIRDGGEATVSELAESVGLARSTVNERLERLLAHGLLEVADPVVVGRGRPASVYRFAPNAGHILACHVGVTGSRLAVTDLAGAVLVDRDLDLDVGRGPESVTDAIATELAAMLDELGSDAPTYGVGIGIPGAVELATAGHDGGAWADHALGDELSRRFVAPTAVARDVELMALGERTGAWPDAAVLLCLKVGTVIGCGIVIDGRIVGGSDGLAGELGHVQVPGRDAMCACGNRGCLNVVAGGGALVRELAGQGFDVAHARDVARLASARVPEAVAAVRQAGRDIGGALASAVNLLNPTVVALWGYLLEAEEPLLAGIRETLYRAAVPASTRRLQLVSAELGRNTGVRGAAIMVAEHVLAPDAIDRRIAAGDADRAAS